MAKLLDGRSVVVEKDESSCFSVTGVPRDVIRTVGDINDLLAGNGGRH
jgi:hypothetical protein